MEKVFELVCPASAGTLPVLACSDSAFPPPVSDDASLELVAVFLVVVVLVVVVVDVADVLLLLLVLALEEDSGVASVDGQVSESKRLMTVASVVL